MKTHWLKNPNKNYLGNWDLPENVDLILTIKSAKWEVVKNPINKKEEEKRVVRFEEKGIKPLICNQTNAKSIMKSTGCKFMEDAVGKKIALFVSVFFDRKEKENVDVVRVRSNSTIIAEKPKLTEEHPNFEDAVKYMQKDGSIDDIKKKYTLSTEIEKKLLQHGIN